MKILIIFLLTLTPCYCQARAVHPKTEIQRQLLDGLVKLITKRSFPPLLKQMKQYFKKKDNVFRKLITDVVIWKSDMIKRIFKMVQDKVDAVESVLWLLFKTTSKPKGRPQWEWLDSDYDWTRPWRGGTKSYSRGNQNYDDDNNGDYNNNGDEDGRDDADDEDDDDDDDREDDEEDGREDDGGERFS